MTLFVQEAPDVADRGAKIDIHNQENGYLLTVHKLDLKSKFLAVNGKQLEGGQKPIFSLIPRRSAFVKQRDVVLERLKLQERSDSYVKSNLTRIGSQWKGTQRGKTGGCARLNRKTPGL